MAQTAQNIKNTLDMTLALIKPHVVKHPFGVVYCKKRIKEKGLNIVVNKRIVFTKELAEEFYSEHKNRYFYNRLITFMISGPSEACIVAGDNAILKWRQIMGPTKVYKSQITHPNSLRSIFGLSDTRNATHGSDSQESALKEINVVFPEYNLNDLVFMINSKKNSSDDK